MTRALAFVVPVIAAVSGYTVLVRAALPAGSVDHMGHHGRTRRKSAPGTRPPRCDGQVVIAFLRTRA